MSSRVEIATLLKKSIEDEVQPGLVEQCQEVIFEAVLLRQELKGFLCVTGPNSQSRTTFDSQLPVLTYPIRALHPDVP